MKSKGICKLLFWKNKNLFIYIILVILFVLMILFIQPLKNEKNNYMPSNMAYVHLKEENVEEFIQKMNDKNIDYYQTIPIEYSKVDIISAANPYSNEFKINLEDLNYVEDVPLDLVKNNQNLINTGNGVSTYDIAYNFNNSIIVDNDTNIKSEVYNVETILEGNYPTSDNEVLVGETIATYYINLYNLNSYEELIGQEIPLKTVDCTEEMFCINEDYRVSGVYRGDYTRRSDEYFIINPTKEITKVYEEVYSSIAPAYFIQADNKKEIEEILNYSYYTYELSEENFKVFPIYELILIGLILFLNLILFIAYKKEIKAITYTLNYYAVSKFWIYLLNLLPFLLLNGILIVVYFIVKGI